MSQPTSDSTFEQPLDLETLRTFAFQRVLSESTVTGSVYLYGYLRSEPAILHIQRTPLTSDAAPALAKDGVESLNVFLENKPYFSAHALLKRSQGSAPDLQIKVIWPATDVHVRKYSVQERVMIAETPEIYKQAVVPYMDSFPPERIEWVFNILDGKKEADRILFRDDDPKTGFIILPDLKWDQTSANALYLTAIVHTKEIRTLRDLTKAHIPLLNNIRQQANNVAKEKFGVENGNLRIPATASLPGDPDTGTRLMVDHFHVHIVHIYHEGLAGMMVGQAHLLDDVISLLELSADAPQPSLLAKMTLTYPLGVEHKLLPLIQAVQKP